VNKWFALLTRRSRESGNPDYSLWLVPRFRGDDEDETRSYSATP
jgi:hypothetical protein